MLIGASLCVQTDLYIIHIFHESRNSVYQRLKEMVNKLNKRSIKNLVL